MTSVQKAIIPGIVLGIIFTIFFTSVLASPRAVQADFNTKKDQAAQAGAGAQTIASTGSDQQPAQGIPGECPLGGGFPDSVVQWCDLVNRYAQEHGIDPVLVASVMLQESGGNPQAYSKSGAVGLLQVMPRDGLAKNFQCVNGPCFASRPTSAELFDPEYNIAYGTQMLAGLINRYGDVREALKAYGPMDMGYRYADTVLSIFERNKQQ